MESRVEQAAQRKRQGMNCAQAVACTYCDYARVDEATMAAITQAFGAGIGGTMDGTCGAITGACAVIGLHNQEAARSKAMQAARYVVESFQARNGEITCKALKGIETGKVLRKCEDCVRDAAEFLEQVLCGDDMA